MRANDKKQEANVVSKYPKCQNTPFITPTAENKRGENNKRRTENNKPNRR